MAAGTASCAASSSKKTPWRRLTRRGTRPAASPAPARSPGSPAGAAAVQMRDRPASVPPSPCGVPSPIAGSRRAGLPCLVRRRGGPYRPSRPSRGRYACTLLARLAALRRPRCPDVVVVVGGGVQQWRWLTRGVPCAPCSPGRLLLSHEGARWRRVVFSARPVAYVGGRPSSYSARSAERGRKRGGNAAERRKRRSQATFPLPKFGRGTTAVIGYFIQYMYA